jgi:hypothetical protein
MSMNSLNETERKGYASKNCEAGRSEIKVSESFPRRFGHSEVKVRW